MGRSPGKWVKTLLFGKKASRSQARSASKSGSDIVAKGSPASAENSPIISEPVLVSTYANGSELEVGNPSFTSQDAEKQGISRLGAETDPEKVREEQAATKAQAAFRGFLARRAFRALRGIIRLQALFRGHLVRRQAVVTLHSMLGILKLQALARGRKVAKGMNSRTNKLYTNTFVCKLLSSSLVVMPLKIQYEKEDSNSVLSWMDRWTFSHFWKRPSQPKKTKRGTYAMETESGRTKRSFKRNSPVNVDSSESEKMKRGPKKVSSSTDTVSEQPLSELEKVKHNLRKVTSMAETSVRSEIESDKQSRTVKKIADMPSDTPNLSIQNVNGSPEDTSKETAPEIASEVVTGPAERLVDESTEDRSPTESYPLQSIEKDENISAGNREPNLKKEHNKRRSSFSAKSEYTENGVQNTPTLPSYMQATQSAKAKLRGHDLPRFGADLAEKNGATRRHSLPSSTNGKVISHSPRMQRMLQATGKAGVRGDRSLLSSRDGSDKLIQVEWRR